MAEGILDEIEMFVQGATNYTKKRKINIVLNNK